MAQGLEEDVFCYDITSNNQTLQNLSVRDVMEQMETFTRIKLSDRYGKFILKPLL